MVEQSVIDEVNRFYKIVTKETINNNETILTYYLRQTYGGIWVICDKTSGGLKWFETTGLHL